MTTKPVRTWAEVTKAAEALYDIIDIIDLCEVPGRPLGSDKTVELVKSVIQRRLGGKSAPPTPRRKVEPPESA